MDAPTPGYHPCLLQGPPSPAETGCARPFRELAVVKRLASALLSLLCLLAFASAARSGDSTQTGTASWFGPGNGVAAQWCTWTLRHTKGCGIARITSLETGITVEAPVIDWCQCYRGTPQERIIDLQWGVVAALGLPKSQGLYPVRVEWLAGQALPDTAYDGVR